MIVVIIAIFVIAIIRIMVSCMRAFFTLLLIFVCALWAECTDGRGKSLLSGIFAFTAGPHAYYCSDGRWCAQQEYWWASPLCRKTVDSCAYVHTYKNVYIYYTYVRVLYSYISIKARVRIICDYYAVDFNNFAFEGSRLKTCRRFFIVNIYLIIYNILYTHMNYLNTLGATCKADLRTLWCVGKIKQIE